MGVEDEYWEKSELHEELIKQFVINIDSDSDTSSDSECSKEEETSNCIEDDGSIEVSLLAEMYAFNFSCCIS